MKMIKNGLQNIYINKYCLHILRDKVIVVIHSNFHIMIKMVVIELVNLNTSICKNSNKIEIINHSYSLN
jgi:hypothetical protein